jgi:hypothetical protein
LTVTACPECFPGQAECGGSCVVQSRSRARRPYAAVVIGELRAVAVGAGSSGTSSWECAMQRGQ